MTRTGAPTRRVVAATMLLAFGVLAPTQTAFADDSEIVITRIDSSGYPTTTIEFSAPAGRTGGTLSTNSVTLREGGKSVPFQLEVVPSAGLEVVLLIDTSASMKEGDAMAAARAAAISFLAVLPIEVPVGVISFADSVSMSAPLTTDRALLAATISQLSAHGETAMYDAVNFARTLFSGASSDRQFVLLSDGGDTVSRASLADALGVSTEIRTNVIELSSSEANHNALLQLANANSGSLAAATDPAALNGAYMQVANSLVNRYRLVFQATSPNPSQYALRVTTADGSVELSADATPPPTPPIATDVATTTTVPDTDTTESGTANSTVNTTPIITTPVAPGGAAGESPPAWLLLSGAGAVFASLVIVAKLMIAARVDPRRRSRLVSKGTRVTKSAENLRARLTGLGDQLLERGDRRRGLALALETSAVALRPGEFVVLNLGTAAIIAFALYPFSGPVGALIGAVLVPLAGRFYLKSRTESRRKAFAAQLPEVLQMMAASLRSGFGLPQALDGIATGGPEPARGEFQRVLLEVRIGRDPGDALGASAVRMHSRDFDWVVTAIQINREIGGDLARIFETLAETVRDRQRMDRQIKSLTAEGRISAYILTALPPVLVVLMSVMNPSYFTPMTKPPGPFLILLGLVMMGLGWVWMNKLIKSKF